MEPTADVTWTAACSLVSLCQKDVALHLRTDLGLGPCQQPCGLEQELCRRILAVLLGIGLERQRAVGHFDLRQRVIGRGRARRYIWCFGNVEPTVTLPTEIGTRLVVNRISPVALDGADDARRAKQCARQLGR